MRCLADGRWVGPHGIGRFATEVIRRMPWCDLVPPGRNPAHPLDPLYLGFLVGRRRPDVFFSPGYNSPLFGIVPVVFTIYDLIHAAGPSGALDPRRLYSSVVIRSAARRACRVLTVSEFSRDSIVRWLGVPSARVVNVGCGVSGCFSPDGPSLGSSVSYVLYVGCRKAHKNLRRLVRAMAMRAVPRELHLVLTGEPDDRIVELAHTEGLGDRIRFAGVLSDSDLARYYRGARCVAMPSLMEGFGLPVIEAMACGTPVVTSDRGPLPEVAGGAALLVDPLNEAELAAAIVRAANDEGMRAERRERGVKNARRYTWDATASRVVDVLSTVVGEASRQMRVP